MAETLKETLHRRAFTSGDWEIWSESGVLQKGDVSRRLTVQQMNVLQYLAQHHDRIVPKEEIFTAVWGDAEVEEVALPRCISELRRALDDDARCPDFIRTFPKRGYQWIAPISDGDTSAQAADVDATDSALEIPPLRSHAPRRFLRPFRLILIAALGLALSAWLAGYPEPPGATQDGPRGDLGRTVEAAGRIAQGSLGNKPSVAVLDLHDLDPRPDNAWLSSALSEMLTSELAISDQLAVIPRAVIANLQDELGLTIASEPSMRALERLRQALGAEVLVSGSYLGSSPKVRLDLRVWRRSELVELEALVEVGSSDDLAALIERAGYRLRERLEIEPSANIADASLRVDELYAKALDLLRRQEAEAAKELLEAAITLRSNDPLAYVALSEAWSQLGYQSRAEEAASRSQALAGDLAPEARLWVQAEVLGRQKKWPEAIARLRALRTLAPENSEYRMRLVRTLNQAGKASGALAEAARVDARGWDSDPRWHLVVAEAHHQLGDFEAATEAASSSIALAQHLETPRVQAAGLVQRALARYELASLPGSMADSMADLEAAQALAGAAEDRRRLAEIEGIRGHWLVTSGRFEAARRHLEAGLTVFQEIGDRRNQARLLRILANVGIKTQDHDAARRWLDQALLLARELAMPSEITKALNTKAILEANLGRFGAARRDFEAALKIDRELGNPNRVAQTIMNLGRISLFEARYDESVERFDEAAELLRLAGTERALATAAYNSGLVKAVTGDLMGAERDLRSAATFFRGIGNDLMLGSTLVALGEVLIDRSRLDEAMSTIEAAKASFNRLGDTARIASATNSVALLALELGEPHRVSDFAEQMARDAEAMRPETRVISLRLQVEAALAADQLQNAASALAEASAMLSSGEFPDTSLCRLWLTISEARLLAAQGQRDAARRVARSIRDQSAIQGAWLAHAEATLVLFQIEIAAGAGAEIEEDLRLFTEQAAAKGWVRIAEQAARLRA